MKANKYTEALLRKLLCTFISCWWWHWRYCSWQRIVLGRIDMNEMKWKSDSTVAISTMNTILMTYKIRVSNKWTSTNVTFMILCGRVRFYMDSKLIFRRKCHFTLIDHTLMANHLDETNDVLSHNSLLRIVFRKGHTRRASRQCVLVCACLNWISEWIVSYTYHTETVFHQCGSAYVLLSMVSGKKLHRRLCIETALFPNEVSCEHNNWMLMITFSHKLCKLVAYRDW